MYNVLHFLVSDINSAKVETKSEDAISSTIVDSQQQVVPLSTAISSTPNSCQSAVGAEENSAADPPKYERYDFGLVFFNFNF